MSKQSEALQFAIDHISGQILMHQLRYDKYKAEVDLELIALYTELLNSLRSKGT